MDNSINNIKGGNAKSDKVDDKWFNLQGQRISKPTVKGLYINGGKKVVVK